MDMKVYFDNAASTRVCDEAIDVMTTVMRDCYGNPSSLHECGFSAKKFLENARCEVAASMGAKPENICFTSGGTEANNWSVFGSAEKYARKGKHIITSAIEHSAVSDPIKKLENSGWDVTYLYPDENGRITGEVFADVLCEDTVFASIMLVNNETGVVNPVKAYSDEIKRRKLDTVLHTDAIQGLCKIPFTVKSTGADLITVSSHKIHGPKGVGALYIKDGVKIAPFILGGSHEKGIRGGTEALPAAVGFGKAAESGMTEYGSVSAHVLSLREYIIKRLHDEVPGFVCILNEDAKFSGNCGITDDKVDLCNISNSPFILPLSLPGYMSEVLMTFLSGEGICVSRSAACKKGARSRTLEAMKLRNDVIDGALRISFSRYNTEEEAEYFVQMMKRASQVLLKKL